MLPFRPRDASCRTRRCTPRRESCTDCRWSAPAPRQSTVRPRWTVSLTDWTPDAVPHPSHDTTDWRVDCSQPLLAPTGFHTASVHVHTAGQLSLAILPWASTRHTGPTTALKTEPSKAGSDSCIQTMWLQSPSTLSSWIPPLGFQLWTSRGPWRAGYCYNNK